MLDYHFFLTLVCVAAGGESQEHQVTRVMWNEVRTWIWILDFRNAPGINWDFQTSLQFHRDPAEPSLGFRSVEAHHRITSTFINIEEDLERWISLPISWLGRIALVKINVLPKLLYPIQMIPVLFTKMVLKDINGWLKSINQQETL